MPVEDSPAPPIPVFSAGAISNIEVSWDNGGHWFRILLDDTFWPNTPMYQTGLGSGAVSYAGYPWLYVHGRPNELLSWKVRITATDVAGGFLYNYEPAVQRLRP